MRHGASGLSNFDAIDLSLPKIRYIPSRAADQHLRKTSAFMAAVVRQRICSPV